MDHQLQYLYTAPCQVPKFEGHDFPKWAKQMTFYLKGTDLWGIVHDTLPAERNRDEPWNQKNNKALGIIFNRCSDEYQEIIYDCITAKDAWDTLSRIFGTSNVAVNKLMNDLNDIKKDPGEDIPHYITRSKAVARSLRAAGENCSNRHVINRLLAGLPRDYDGVRDNLSLRPELDFEVITAALLETEARLKARRGYRIRSISPRERQRGTWGSGNWSSNGRQEYRVRLIEDDPRPPSTPFRKQCSYCHKIGHIIVDCWKLHPDKKQQWLWEQEEDRVTAWW